MIARLDDLFSIKRVSGLLRYGPVGFHFEAQGTRFDMIICTAAGVAGGHEMGLHGNRIIVAIVNFHVSYHFEMGGLHSGYVQEKLRLSHRGDAENITALLNAMFHDTPADYLEKVCDASYPDQVDHERGLV